MGEQGGGATRRLLRCALGRALRRFALRLAGAPGLAADAPPAFDAATARRPTRRTRPDRRLRSPCLTPLLAALLALSPLAAPAQDGARPWAEIRAARPDLFHPDTGFRIARQRAPTPADIPAPARLADAAETRALLSAGAVAVDVYGAFSPRYDELDGSWRERSPRLSLPGATWLPEVGRGTLTPEIAAWFAAALDGLTQSDPARTLIFFCVADCWMSWNAARRAAETLGYGDVRWFRLGTDGWLDAGWALAPVAPTPVDLDAPRR